MFKNRGMYYVYLNVNSLLSKRGEIYHLAKLLNTSVIGIIETKLDGSLLSNKNKVATECHHLIKKIVLEKELELLVSSNTLLLAVIKLICALTMKVFLKRYIYLNQNCL